MQGGVHFWTTNAQLAGFPGGGRIGSSKGEAGRNRDASSLASPSAPSQMFPWEPEQEAAIQLLRFS